MSSSHTGMLRYRPVGFYDATGGFGFAYARWIHMCGLARIQAASQGLTFFGMFSELQPPRTDEQESAK